MAATAPRATTSLAGAEFVVTRASRSFWGDAWVRFRADRLAMGGAIVFLLLCLMALSADWISASVTGYEPSKMDLRATYQSPSDKHWFGTDEYGRDYFTRILYAGRVSLGIGFLFTLISLTLGVLLGLTAGFYGGLFDDGMQGAINVVTAIPNIPLYIIIGSMFSLDVLGLVLLLSAFGWVGPSRYLRGLVLSIKQRDYVMAARTVGSTNGRIMLQHILPNVLSAVLIYVGFDIAGAILSESALSFLGFGIRPPTASWGNMLSNSLQYTKYPWMVFFPGLAISLTVLSVFMLADGLRDAMDPRLRR